MLHIYRQGFTLEIVRTPSANSNNNILTYIDKGNLKIWSIVTATVNNILYNINVS